MHFVDFKVRAASRGELTRFAQRFGIAALIDTASARYRNLGLTAVRYSDDRWIDCLCAEPLLLRQPLARFGNRLAIGAAESEWETWIEAGKAT